MHGAETGRLLHVADWIEIRAVLRQRAVADAAARPLTQRNPGEGRSIFVARGMDYAESRPYQAGDDMRSMHWQLLARTGKPHVKLYHEEHAGSWHGLIDMRGPMLFGTRVRTKAQQAARVALLAAGLQALASPQTLIACTLWRADGLHGRGFGRGSVAVRRLAAWLMAEPVPAPGAVAGQNDRADRPREAFASWVKSLLAGQPGPSRLALASDWSWADAQTDATLWRVAAFVDVRATRVRDPAEIELPAMPGAWFEDAAGGVCGWVELDSAARQHHANAAAGAAAARARALRSIGVPLGEVLTPENAAEILQALALPARTQTGSGGLAAQTAGAPRKPAMPT